MNVGQELVHRPPDGRMVQKCPVRQFEGPEFDRPACLGVDRLDHGEVLHEGDDAVFGRCDEQGLRQLGGGGLGIEAMPQQPAHGEHRELPRRDVRDAAVGTDQDDGVGLDLRRGQRGDAGTEAQAEQHQGSAGICLPGPVDDRDGVGEQNLLRRLAGAGTETTVVHEHRGRVSMRPVVDVGGHLLRIAAEVDDQRTVQVGVDDPAAQHRVAARDLDGGCRSIQRRHGDWPWVEDELVLERPEQGAGSEVGGEQRDDDGHEQTD